MMIRLLALLCLSAALEVTATSRSRASEPPLSVLVEEYPPFVVDQDGHAAGPYVEAFQQLMQEHDMHIHVELMPIRRAMTMAQATPGVCVLAIDYAPSDAEVLHYLGRVAPMYVWAYARHGDGVRVHSIADLSHYTVGIEDIADVRQQLDDAGIRYSVLSQKMKGPQMLQAHRFEVLISDVGAELEAGSSGITIDRLYTVASVERWVACNPHSDTAAMNAMRGALSEGLFAESVRDIWSRYGLEDYFLRARKSWSPAGGKP
jgi:polar amino acid transport system substrate-binding protein